MKGAGRAGSSSTSGRCWGRTAATAGGAGGGGRGRSPCYRPGTPVRRRLRSSAQRTFNFLSVFEWGVGRGVRKGVDVLLNAYLNEFRREDDVSLVLRVHSIDGRSPVS